ncbi:ArsR/SmtB family transcription factor [Alicyclobacillus fastidiosus]|uniref:ArsR family transcriptional regulator n=1 Tax=Alicyclobacillus fastidiosus TaxID=392011 RepID=A0ABV5AG89_9BACL|nr:ArsR family transcriptional regulator [Alicyclobacillus fastidiosus]WEH08901.1 ArsR family transcriptional regulator [Alicyclobacillus fastidiosus]
MNVLDLDVARRKYDIRIDSSMLYECALGIGAFTWEQVHDKLDIGQAEIRRMNEQMSAELRQEVQLAGSHHTWRSLLFLLHRCPQLQDEPQHAHLGIFTNWIHELQDDIIAKASPYLGDAQAELLHRALAGSMAEQEKLLQIHADNPVVYLHLQFLFSTSPDRLLGHIERLMTGWYQEMLRNGEEVMQILERAAQETKKLALERSTEDVIRQITRGGELEPEPGVSVLWLIPQLAYRPFTIRNHLPGSAVFYYPVDEDHLTDTRQQKVFASIAAQHKAVGDIHRVQLLKLLSMSPKPLADLAEGIGASKPSTHHHLLLLRTAGLVSVRSGVYELNIDAVASLSDGLYRLLNLDPS